MTWGGVEEEEEEKKSRCGFCGSSSCQEQRSVAFEACEKNWVVNEEKCKKIHSLDCVCVCVCLSLTKSKTRNEFYLRFLTLFASHTIGLLTLTRVSVCRCDMEGCVKLCRLVLLEEWVKLELNLKAIWNFKDDKYQVFIQEKSKCQKQTKKQPRSKCFTL